MTTGKTIVLTRWTFVGKVMSLLLNMLSRLVITFFPRSKRLLISWLQSPFTVTLATSCKELTHWKRLWWYGKDWGQEEKGMTEDEMVGWNHQLDGREFEQAPRVGDGQGCLTFCSPWGHRELDVTEWLNWTERGFQSQGFISLFLKLTYDSCWTMEYFVVIGLWWIHE